MKDRTKTRIYKEGDATGKLIYDPHGRRTHGWGHRGLEFGYTLYVYKAGQGSYVLAMSLHRRVYIAYVRAIVKAVADTPIPTHRVSHTYWLEGKTWQHPRGKECPILKED